MEKIFMGMGLISTTVSLFIRDDLVVPVTRTVRYCSHSFVVTGPSIYNSLLILLHSCHVLSLYPSWVQNSELFDRAYY